MSLQMSGEKKDLAFKSSSAIEVLLQMSAEIKHLPFKSFSSIEILMERPDGIKEVKIFKIVSQI